MPIMKELFCYIFPLPTIHGREVHDYTYLKQQQKYNNLPNLPNSIIMLKFMERAKVLYYNWFKNLKLRMMKDITMGSWLQLKSSSGSNAYWISFQQITQQKCISGEAEALAFNRKSFHLFLNATKFFKSQLHSQKFLYTKHEKLKKKKVEASRYTWS